MKTQSQQKLMARSTFIPKLLPKGNCKSYLENSCFKTGFCFHVYLFYNISWNSTPRSCYCTLATRSLIDACRIESKVIWLTSLVCHFLLDMSESNNLPQWCHKYLWVHWDLKNPSIFQKGPEPITFWQNQNKCSILGQFFHLNYSFKNRTSLPVLKYHFPLSF